MVARVTKAETNAVYAAALVQGIALVTFSAASSIFTDRYDLSSTQCLAGLGCSALLPLTISFGQGQLRAVSASVAGGVIAFYQLGYGIAALGAGALQDAGIGFPAIVRASAAIAIVMGVLSFVLLAPASGSEG